MGVEYALSEEIGCRVCFLRRDVWCCVGDCVERVEIGISVGKG